RAAEPSPCVSPVCGAIARERRAAARARRARYPDGSSLSDSRPPAAGPRRPRVSRRPVPPFGSGRPRGAFAPDVCGADRRAGLYRCRRCARGRSRAGACMSAVGAAVDRRPGLDEKRLTRLIHRAIERCALNLGGLTVLTEAASGAYVVTPVLAALAGADRVFAITRSTRYGSVEEIRESTLALARRAGVDGR